MKFEEVQYRMHHQQLYYSDDSTLMMEQMKRLDLVHEYNHMLPSKQKEKQILLKSMFQHIGDDCHIETPFYANWGGLHVSIGNHVYINFNLVLIDDTYITIGNHVMIGPNVVLCAGNHPTSIQLRKKQAQYNLPIVIEDNVWIGANSIILPGITIGENSIIGSGSIVTSNIPSNVVAAGNPCSILRPLNKHDETHYNKDTLIDIE